MDISRANYKIRNSLGMSKNIGDKLLRSHYKLVTWAFIFETLKKKCRLLFDMMVFRFNGTVNDHESEAQKSTERFIKNGSDGLQQ